MITTLKRIESFDPKAYEWGQKVCRKVCPFGTGCPMRKRGGYTWEQLRAQCPKEPDLARIAHEKNRKRVLKLRKLENDH